MPTKKTLEAFLDELASSSPAPGGGSVAALAVEEEMKKILVQAEEMRGLFTALIDKDTQAFNKVMEAFSLPKETEPQKALRSAAIREATKEATNVPLEVMKHCIDALALTQQVAVSGNVNSVSDAGVSAYMLHAAVEGAALNVRINLNNLNDSEFVGWKTDEMDSLRNTSRMMLEEIQGIVADKLKND
jgi:formiminotetrahydrofolate cyclodeaminase